MSAVSRRGLFGLLAGAAVAPLLSRLPGPTPARTIIGELEFAAPGSYTRYSGYEVLTNFAPSRIAGDFRWKS